MLLHDLNDETSQSLASAQFPSHDRLLDVSYFPAVSVTRPRSEQLQWQDLVPVLLQRDVRDEKDGLLLGGYLCTGTRRNADVPFKSLIQLDIDSKMEGGRLTSTAPVLEAIRAAIDEFEWVAASSHGHDPANGMVKYRITLLPDRNILEEEHQAVMEALNEKLQLCLDEKSWAWSQAYYLPSCPAQTHGQAFAVHNVGRAICVDDLVARGQSILGFKGRTKSKNSQRLVANLTSGLPGRLDETPENVKRLEDALKKLDPDMDRPEWLSVIWSVHAHGWTCGKSIAQSWSAKGNKYNQKTPFDRDWDDFDPSREDAVPARRVYEMAKVKVPDAVAANDNEDWLVQMNENYCWVQKEAGIYRREHGDFIDTDKFRTGHLNKNVLVGGKLVSQANAWLSHAERREFKQLVFRPGEPEIVHGELLNIWKGFAVEPVAGDVQPWLDLLARMVPDQADRHFVLSWLKQIIQNPGSGNSTALVVWSKAQGVGKNLLFDCVRDIIGQKHATTIGQNELESRFTSWAEGKLLVIGDEVVGLDRRQDADKFKVLITGTTIQIEEKNQPRREMENFANFILLSNHPDAVYVDPDDRRFFVVEVRSGQLPQQERDAFALWRANGGLAALLHFLLTDPIRNYDPHARAPMTAAKANMLEDNRSDLERWVTDRMGGNVAQHWGREVATADALCGQYNVGAARHASTKAMSNALYRAGAEKYRHQVTLPDGRRARVWILANAQHWHAQPAAAVVVELQKGSGYL